MEKQTTTMRTHSDLLSNQVILRVSIRRSVLSRRGLVVILIQLLFAIYPIIGVYMAQVKDKNIYANGAMEAFHGWMRVLFEIIIFPFSIAIVSSFLISDEIEDRTITYWLIRPIPRYEIFASKLLSLFFGVTLMSLIVVSFNFLMFAWGAQILGEQIYWGLLAHHLAIAIVANLFFASIMTFFATRFPHSILISIIYLILWEYLIYGIINISAGGGLRWFFARNYIEQYQEFIANEFFQQTFILDVSSYSNLLILGLLTLVFSFLAMRSGEKREYP